MELGSVSTPYHVRERFVYNWYCSLLKYMILTEFASETTWPGGFGLFGVFCWEYFKVEFSYFIDTELFRLLISS